MASAFADFAMLSINSIEDYCRRRYNDAIRNGKYTKSNIETIHEETLIVQNNAAWKTFQSIQFAFRIKIVFALHT